MTDTSEKIAAMVAERHRSMTPLERLQAASSLYDSARRIVDASLPAELTREQRRLAAARRMYPHELPEAALIAHARFAGESSD